MSSTEPITFQRLLDWIERGLTDAEAQSLEAQLATANSQTQQTIDWLRAFRAVRSQITLETPPAPLHAALLNQFQPTLAQRVLRRVTALLTFDSAQQPALAGVRSGESRTLQVIYDSDLMEIAISIRPSRQSDRLDLHGQVFPHAQNVVSDLVVRLFQGNELTDIALTNQFGEFSFTAVPAGLHTLSLIAEANQLELEAFEVPLRIPA
jgi:hypothetical protein